MWPPMVTQIDRWSHDPWDCVWLYLTTDLILGCFHSAHFYQNQIFSQKYHVQAQDLALDVVSCVQCVCWNSLADLFWCYDLIKCWIITKAHFYQKCENTVYTWQNQLTVMSIKVQECKLWSARQRPFLSHTFPRCLLAAPWPPSGVSDRQ